MTYIACDSHSEEAAGVISGLLPRLSGLIAPATELLVELDQSMPSQCPLYHCMPYLVLSNSGPK